MNDFPMIAVELIAVGVVMTMVYLMLDVVTEVLWGGDDDDVV